MTTANPTANMPFAKPSTHVVLHEDTIERESPQSSAGLAPSDNSLLQSSYSPSPSPSSVSLPSQLEYVSACLTAVRDRVKTTGASLTALFPDEDIAYELHSNYYQPKMGKLLANAYAREEQNQHQRTKQSTEFKKSSSSRSAPPRVNSISGDIIVTEDQLPLDSLVDSLSRLGYNPDSHLDGYDKLTTFQHRVDYVYKCLKYVENKNNEQKKRVKVAGNGEKSRGPSENEQEDMYKAATKSLMMTEAMNKLADELVKVTGTKAAVAPIKSKL